MCAIGFTGAMGPLCIAIGFKDKETMARATAVSFLLLSIVTTLKATNVTNAQLELFAPSLTFMGAFVGYLGLLIASDKWFEHEKNWGGYGGRQVITILFGLAALLFGSVLDMPALLKVGGTFFGIYLLEKLGDFVRALELESFYGWCFILLVCGGMLYGGGNFILHHREFFARYLFMPGN
jgi:hypothetical protein